MGHQAKVLIVDDNENNRYTLRRRLSRLQFGNVTEAEHGQEALDILESTPQDIILLDVMMPVMDGFEVLERIKSNPKLANTPVIMISAIDDLDNIVKAIELGADDYLPKPFNPIVLEARMKAAVRKKRLINIETNYYRDFDKDTDLAKFDLFSGNLDGEMNRDVDTSFTVIHVQFNHYDFIVQTLGSTQANEYIKKQIGRLKQIFSDDDTFFGRLSEDVIAISNAAKNITNMADQATMYQSVYAPLKQTINIDQESFEGNIGIGISTGRAREIKPQTLLSNASFAAQTALDNEVGLSFYDPELHRENIEKFHLEPKLREALRARKLVLYYQPIVNTQTSKIESFEALIRWPQSDGSMIPPFKFITLAEETGLINDIDSFVLDETCRQISLWRDKFSTSEKFTIGANISAKHWVNPALVQEVKEAVQKHNIPFDYLKLEMTESAMIDNAEAVQTNVHKLKELGVKIALDDFGTGYSSLAYLIDFPVDILKVDKVFVDDMHTDAKKRQLITHILNIAQSLNMTTIVEGVELEEQYDEFKKLNCHQIQGYFFYKPLSVSEIEKIVM